MSNFHDGTLVELDSRNRVSLSRLDPKRNWCKRYMMHERHDGVIELTPVDVVPLRPATEPVTRSSGAHADIRIDLDGDAIRRHAIHRDTDAAIAENDQRNGLEWD